MPTDTAGPAQAIVTPTADADAKVAMCLGAWARPVTPPRSDSGASACTSEPVTVNIAAVAHSAIATAAQAAANHPAVGLMAPLPNATASMARTVISTPVARRNSCAGQSRCQVSVTQVAPANAPTPAAKAISHR
jgi:hypothetical protein